MTQNEFARQQQAAVERMREMNARSQISQNQSHKMPPVPSFVKLNENSNNQNLKSDQENVNKASIPQPQSKPKHNPNKNANMGIPFLESLLKDADSTLIIGLLLILMSENSDKIMLFALIYILL
jgi:hypothetical protein